MDKFYEFLLTLSEEAKIAYALFTALSKDQTNLVIDSTHALCLVIHEYHTLICYDEKSGDKMSLYYEGVIRKLDDAINGPKAGSSPSAIGIKLTLDKCIRSITAPNKS